MENLTIHHAPIILFAVVSIVFILWHGKKFINDFKNMFL